ncbi:NRDE family protein [Flavitalea antarctica]
MCTVTFLPTRKGVYITSNRDEKNVRASALYPEAYEFSTGKLIFPKDADAGGTWIAAHENGNAIVLLNGGVVKHISMPPYRKSRGLIVLDLINHSEPFQAFKGLDLENIEPFTAIIWEHRSLYECRWDGNQKFTKQPDAAQPHIWSSVTLYTPAVIMKREQWFAEWLRRNQAPSQDDILNFHQFTGDGDTNNDLLMNRDGETFTVSITSISLEKYKARVSYLDLKQNQRTDAEFALQKNLVSVK